MKIRIKTYNGELPSYLTVGKVYEVTTPMNKYGIAQILSDDGYPIDVQIIFSSDRLNGGSWEAIE